MYLYIGRQGIGSFSEEILGVNTTPHRAMPLPGHFCPWQRAPGEFSTRAGRSTPRRPRDVWAMSLIGTPCFEASVGVQERWYSTVWHCVYMCILRAHAFVCGSTVCGPYQLSQNHSQLIPQHVQKSLKYKVQSFNTFRKASRLGQESLKYNLSERLRVSQRLSRSLFVSHVLFKGKL